MDKQAKQQLNFRKLASSKKPEEGSVLKKSFDDKIDVDTASPDHSDQPIVYDYMKYPVNKKKNAKPSKGAKIQKTVSFKTVVELVTYTENWKIKVIHGKLRTEEEQVLMGIWV
ncbi:hypothetical protein KR032_007518 [Drosophila birchii]|nr:hypothetical protein KR032_007518 [Drosophila birchii]